MYHKLSPSSSRGPDAYMEMSERMDSQYRYVMVTPGQGKVVSGARGACYSE